MQEPHAELKSSGSVPFFLRVVSIIIMVTGFVGVVFYLLVAIYQIADRNFLYELKYKGFSGIGYYTILLTQLALNIGLIVSSMLLLKLRRVGLYLFIISYIVFAFLSYLLQDDYGWTIPVVGMALLIVIALHYKKLT
jgi:hypothetical protein